MLVGQLIYCFTVNKYHYNNALHTMMSFLTSLKIVIKILKMLIKSFCSTHLDLDHMGWKPDNCFALIQGTTGHRKNREFESPFFQTGNLLKNIKNLFLHREFTTNTGKILRVKKNNELVIYLDGIAL